jgi:nuclear pore complex protein Nup85
LKEHILHVSLRLDIQDLGGGGGTAGAEGMDVEGEAPEDQFAHYKAIKEVCEEFVLEEEWKIISRIIADSLIRRGEYGLASTMCIQGGDGATLSRISEEILDAFILKGEIYCSYIFPPPDDVTRRGRLLASG